MQRTAFALLLGTAAYVGCAQSTPPGDSVEAPVDATAPDVQLTKVSINVPGMT